MERELWIAVDFDGTMVIRDEFPNIAEENPYAIKTVKRLRNDGFKIMLHTCRDEDRLQDAVNWMIEKGVEPDAVNYNPYTHRIYGKPSKKIYADLYIDDRCIAIKKNEYGGVDFKYIYRNYDKLFSWLKADNP